MVSFLSADKPLYQDFSFITQQKLKHTWLLRLSRGQVTMPETGLSVIKRLWRWGNTKDKEVVDVMKVRGHICPALSCSAWEPGCCGEAEVNCSQRAGRKCEKCAHWLQGWGGERWFFRHAGTACRVLPKETRCCVPCKSYGVLRGGKGQEKERKKVCLCVCGGGGWRRLGVP